MNSILYANGKCEVGKRLQKSIEGMISTHQREVFNTGESLAGRLHHGETYGTIAVRLVTNPKELFDLLSIRDLLFDVRIILILPDREMETISKGHSLYPRYLTYVDSDFRDMSAVLEKMLGIIDKNNITTKRR